MDPQQYQSGLMEIARMVFRVMIVGGSKASIYSQLKNVSHPYA